MVVPRHKEVGKNGPRVQKLQLCRMTKCRKLTYHMTRVSTVLNTKNLLSGFHVLSPHREVTVRYVRLRYHFTVSIKIALYTLNTYNFHLKNREIALNHLIGV